MRNKIRQITALLLLLVMSAALFAACGSDAPESGSATPAANDGGAAEEQDPEPETPDLSGVFTIVSAYAGVDWANFKQYKTALHVHSTNSDGNSKLDTVIEEHYKKDYEILAITDHNVLTADWVTARNGITQERYEEMQAGVGRDGKYMLRIPNTNEQSYHDHVNTFFTEHNNPNKNTLENMWASLQAAEDQGGLSHVNHPGRYTGGENNKDRSFDPDQIKKYTDIFETFTTCVGMEIINKKDGESKNDRYLWDNINAVTIPQGIYVWGFSNDDTHNNSDTGYSYNMFVQRENTLEAFRETMHGGNFYSVAYFAYNEGVTNMDLSVPAPVIKSITVDSKAATITLIAENYDKIEWFNEKTEVIASGETISIEDVADKANVFVRAHIVGQGAVAWTQPFGIVKH